MALDDDDEEDDAWPASDDDAIAHGLPRTWAVVVAVVVVAEVVFAAAVARITATIATRFKVAILLVLPHPNN